jgi:hypothetical protein
LNSSRFVGAVMTFPKPDIFCEMGEAPAAQNVIA